MAPTRTMTSRAARRSASLNSIRSKRLNCKPQAAMTIPSNPSKEYSYDESLTVTLITACCDPH